MKTIVIYSNSSLSCTKALKFFKSNNIEIEKINVITKTLSEKLIYDILYLTENGFNDIINPKHIFLVKNKIDWKNMSIKKMVHLIQHEPTILKRPIIIQFLNNHPYRLQIGFSKEDIKLFLR